MVIIFGLAVCLCQLCSTIQIAYTATVGAQGGPQKHVSTTAVADRPCPPPPASAIVCFCVRLQLLDLQVRCLSQPSCSRQHTPPWQAAALAFEGPFCLDQPMPSLPGLSPDKPTMLPLQHRCPDKTNKTDVAASLQSTAPN